MSFLKVTLIDVGWGDSLFIEASDSNEAHRYALVDCNDTTTLRSSYIFLRRFFERRQISIPTADPLFQWVALTHAHSDHGQGLKRILRDYGTQQFWYSKSASRAAFFTDLLRYAQNSPRVIHHQAVDATKVLPNFGDVSMQILWPPHNSLHPNENNNSIVFTLTLGTACFVLTGDAEADVWSQIAFQIPPSTKFFKIPHHGSDNGTFAPGGLTPWLNRVGGAVLAISSHVRPFPHPSPAVINTLNSRGITYYRTDEHYHITVQTDGRDVWAKYSHI